MGELQQKHEFSPSLPNFRSSETPIVDVSLVYIRVPAGTAAARPGTAWRSDMSQGFPPNMIAHMRVHDRTIVHQHSLRKAAVANDWNLSSFDQFAALPTNCRSTSTTSGTRCRYCNPIGETSSAALCTCILTTNFHRALHVYVRTHA